MIYASPTSLSRHGACRRKQAYSRRIKDNRQTPAAAFGVALHSQGSSWLRDGTPPDPDTAPGMCILAGLPYLPMPGTCLHVEPPASEESFDNLQRFEHDGISYVFRVDFAYLYSIEARAAWDGHSPVSPTTHAVVIGDHKSCGQLSRTEFPKGEPPRRRAPSDMTDDLQRLIYGEWALRTYPEFEAIGAHWQYYQRKPAGTFPLFVLEHRANLHARFEYMHATATAALAADHGIPPEELPRNFAACSDYGGCPYRPECHEGVDPVHIALATIRRR
jgi:hypothetical protein